MIFKMKLCLEIIILITAQLKSSLAARCQTTNDHKNYTCIGYRFRLMTASPWTRQQLLRVRIFDCKETHIPEEALNFPNLQNLTLSCGTETFHENAFKNLNHLQELDLGNNTISILPNNMFQSLGELRTLNLSHNNFEELTITMFDGLNNLKQLILSHNIISELGVKAFNKMTELEEIYLNNNQINFLPRVIFNKLRKLRLADLSYNSIENLGELFAPTYRLVYLNLSHNAITNLRTGSFQATRLEVLDLSYNKLTVITEDALKLDTLQELYLQDNQISLFEVRGVGLNNFPLSLLDVRNNRLVFLENTFIKTATNLLTLKVGGNPWDCECYQKMETLRGELALDVSAEHQAGAQPLCVIGNTSGCNIDINNLMFYYNVYKEQQDLRK